MEMRSRHNHLTYALLAAPCGGPVTRTSTNNLADSSISCCRVVLQSLTCIDQHTASCRTVLMPLKPYPCRIRKTMADRTVTDAASTARDGSAMSLWSSDVLEPKELPQHTRK